MYLGLTAKTLAAKHQEGIERWRLDMLSRWYTLRKTPAKALLPLLTISDNGLLMSYDDLSWRWQEISYEEVERMVNNAEQAPIRKQPGRAEYGAGAQGAAIDIQASDIRPTGTR